MSNEKPSEYRSPQENIPATVSHEELVRECKKHLPQKPAETEEHDANEISR